MFIKNRNFIISIILILLIIFIIYRVDYYVNSDKYRISYMLRHDICIIMGSFITYYIIK